MNINVVFIFMPELFSFSHSLKRTYTRRFKKNSIVENRLSWVFPKFLSSVNTPYVRTLTTIYMYNFIYTYHSVATVLLGKKYRSLSKIHSTGLYNKV